MRAVEGADSFGQVAVPSACLSACATDPSAPELVAQDFSITASDPGTRLFLRNKRQRRSVDAPRPDRTVLFVHGLTYPGHTAFDLPLAGRSWMDDLASAGFDTWCVDIRGFGKSTRPAAMDQPPQANPPVLDAATATSDVASAVHFIRQRRGLDRISIVGWSWGTVLSACFASLEPRAVERLVLYAPVWRCHRDTAVPNAPSGAYRSVTREAARRNWLGGVPPSEQERLIPPGWFEQWVDATWATDAVGAQATPPVLRAPNGPLAEVIAHWASDKPMFEPDRLVAPTLLTVAEWDRTTPPYMAQELLPMLTRARETRLALIPGGTHQVFLERNRQALFAAVQQWLVGGQT